MDRSDDEVAATDPRTVDTVDVPAALRGRPALEPRQSLGRYSIEELIGAGGMGEVYRAIDEPLKRAVAIKVVRSESGRERLLEEAQAMAKLSHPNVVVVYEAGLVDGRVFIAMEYVAGATLRAWAKGRAWRELVRMYVAAGRGLAALHAAKLVHRDFKPDNVLVGEDGRPRVADFGLAVHEAEPATVHGGTVRYMAPEQRSSTVVDARTDQFAFCVALWEAITGELPNDARTTRAMPPWVRVAIARGLATDPAERWPSLDALLERLERDPAVRRRRVLAGAGVAALAAVTGVALYTRGGDPAHACDAVASRIARAWTPFDAGIVRARFAASQRAHAPATTEHVRAALDRYETDWSDTRRDVCLATAVRNEQTAHSSELRVQCLDRLADEMHALVTVFERDADPALVDQAMSAVNQLRPASDCADAQALDAIPAPPLEQRARVAELQAEHDAVDAAFKAGRYKPILARARANAAAADALGYAPVQAEAAMSVALLENALRADADAERDYRSAIAFAGTAHDDHVMNVACRGFVVSAILKNRFDDAAERLAFAQAALARSGNPPLFTSRLEDTHASLMFAQGDFAGALAASDRSIQIATRGGLSGTEIASLLNQRGRILVQMHRDADALVALSRARAIWETELGPDVPQSAGVLLNIANAEENLQHYEDAERDLDRSAKLTEAAFGPTALNLGRVLNNRCEVRFLRHDLAGAAADCDRALAIKTKATRADSPELATTLMTMAKLAEQRGDVKTAGAIDEQILAIHVKALGEHHAKVAQDHYTLGERALHEQRLREAREHVERGLGIARDAHDDALVAAGLADLADVQRAGGDFAAARTTIADALARHELLAKSTDAADSAQQLANDHSIMGRIDQATGDLAGAERELRRAVELVGPFAGEGQGLLAPHLENLGAVLAAAHQNAEAATVLARALAIVEATAGSASERAQLETELANARR